ncbi:hypothetical protein GH5_07198 [Leishmania sp. Ghana 2012 LV757]|uniref:hypothetical protein n=1 Tax=Leishmania sp. Ghana 2012 LV757 TaxID=2803181 RepID=UPI001B71A691|nr:hypothetical protein GH5_07198 [Leishmania sp. Ghana 2012 LV757]
MTERITVAVRARPFLPHEDTTSCVMVSHNQITVGTVRPFAFDRVFDETASSDDIYVALGQPLADSFLSGFHASTIAYGQTGAGKTFTMAALLSDTVQEIFCRLAEDADLTQGNGRSSTPLTSSSGTADASTTFSMTLSVLEVYNESIGDLLASPTLQPLRPPAKALGGTVLQAVGVSAPRRHSTHGGSARHEQRPFQRRASAPASSHPSNSLALREDPHGGVYVEGLTEAHVHSETELLALIDGAIGNRKTASTLMNATSSRSHCVVTLTLQRRGMCSRCCFVDLAGSERLKKSLGLASPSDRHGSSGTSVEASLLPSSTVAARMREGININTGLLALGNVIVALCDKKTHVPYRSSKLTRLLQPMLGGNARTAMIACISQLASSLEETLNTLKYAHRAKRIQIDPHLAVAAVTSSVDAQRTIALLREQLEDAQRRLGIAAAAATGACPRRAAGSPERAETPSPSAALMREVEHLRELLLHERQVTQRLENEVFNAEYTAMIEVEKRKVLEARVAELEAASAATLEGEEPTAVTAGGDTEHAAGVSLSPRSRLTMNMARLQQLEDEREALAAMRAQKVRDTVRLEAALVGDEGCGVGELAAASTAGASDPLLDQLTEEIVAKERQIARLQKENSDVSALLEQYEKGLQRTLSSQAHLRAELRKAEAQLEKSEMALEQREQEKEKLLATYEERLRRAEEKVADYRRRVKEATQQMRERQADLDKTRQLRGKVVELLEEVSRQRLRLRATQKASWQLNADHQQEVAQLQKQLQLTTAHMTLLHQRMNRKDAAIAKVRKQLAEQQLQLEQPQQGLPTPACLRHQPPEKSPSPMPSSSSVKVSPPLSAVADTPSHSIKSRKNSYATPPPTDCDVEGLSGNMNGVLTSSRDGDVTQATINRELQDLERMEKEIAELLEYRRVLLTARATDAPKWHRAKEGFACRLAQIQVELQSSEPSQLEHTSLLEEKRTVEEKLRQLRTFDHMFADADQQLAEFDNRIENLNEARRFHTQRVRRLQGEAARPCEGGAERAGYVDASTSTSSAPAAPSRENRETYRSR